jgi:hypothetical protein
MGKKNNKEIVEAIATAIEAKMFAPHELPLDAELHAKYLDTARKALAVAKPLIIDQWIRKFVKESATKRRGKSAGRKSRE